MTEAPLPKKEFSINIDYDEKIYEINLSEKSNNLLIKVEEKFIPFNRYEEEFSKSSLNQISKFFKMFDHVSEFIPELKKRIENKNFKIIIENKIFKMFIKVDILTINEFCLQLKKKEQDLGATVESLSKIIDELNGKIKELEEDKIQTNNKIKILENEIKIIKENLLF